MAATIKIKNSSTTGAVPTSSDLVQGELAVNVTDLGLYTENASGTIVKLNAPSIDDKNTGATKRLTIDTSGNLGLGVTPSAWGGSYTKAFQLKNGGGIVNNVDNDVHFFMNCYYNGTNWIYGASNPASRYEQYNGGHYWFSAASGTAGTTASFTQAMTLDASGNLLTGTTSYYGEWGGGAGTIQGISTSYGNISSGSSRSDQNGVRIGSFSFDWTTNTSGYRTRAIIEAQSNGSTANKRGADMLFYTAADNTASPTERARIDSSGNLLVGTTSVPGAGSATTGASLLPSGCVTIQRTAATPFFCGRSNDGEVMALYSGTTQRGQVSISGATTTYGSFSDYRLKENVVPLTGAVAKVMALKPSTFNFIEFPEQTINGFIAHEVAEVEPIAVTGEKDGVDEEGKLLYQSVDPAKLVPLLTAALQEQQQIIQQLQADVAALKGQA